MSLEEKYPFIASWVMDGQIQIGQAEYYDPIAAVYETGGTVWETNGFLLPWMHCLMSWSGRSATRP